jgi:hypothetical protein
MESARKTLAAKHKIRKPSITYRRYYRDGINRVEWKHIQVVVERENRPPLVAKCGETPLRTRKTSYISDKIPPKVIAGTTSELLTRLLAGKCELCNCMANLEAHHVNKLKNLRKRWQGKRNKPKWVQHMIARRRKTIVVCHACHQQITHGRYDGQRVN